MFFSVVLVRFRFRSRFGLVSVSFRMRLIVRFSYIKRISLVLLSLFPANVAGVGVGFLSFGVY